MARVDKIFKEREYYKKHPEVEKISNLTPNLEGILINQLGESSRILDALRLAPAKNTLAIIGAITILYIGFKLVGKFVKIKRALEKD